MLGLCLASCSGGKKVENGSSTSTSSVTKEAEALESDTKAADIQEKIVEVIVDNATGEFLGIKVNEVGDYYIINPGDEELIPKEGHSVKVLD